MERTTAADASFLYMENPVVHMHVTGVMLIDPSTAPDGFSFDLFRRFVTSRLHRIPPFRRRLRIVPLGIDHPVLVDDPDFDLDNHLHSDSLVDGSRAGLAEWVGRYASEPLDRDRPLWDMVLLEGLEDGKVAMVSKIHHILVDGTSGTDLMVQLVDLKPEFEMEDPPPFEPEDSVPNFVRLMAGAVASRVVDPLRGVRALGRGLGSVGRVMLNVTGSSDGPTMARPFDAPRTLFNRSITARRSVAFSMCALDDLKFVKSTFGATVNDVVLAACTQSLRSYLANRGETFERPLVVSVPVSVRGKVTDGSSANQVSNMFVRLPVHLTDPVDQLRAVRVDTRDAKAVHGAIGADMIGDVTEVTPPAIFNLASRLYSSAGLADRLAPIHNLVISNVPGPPFPLYIAGAQLVGMYPFGPLIEGSGLNITVLSNMGNMDIGVIACPDIAPDVDEVTDGIVDAIEVLRQAAVAAVEAEATEPKTPAVKKSPARKAPAKKAPAKKSPAKKAPAKKAPAKKAPAKKAT
ncbi:WS/DGAT/MGAT family O-acyltransferase [Candidatus Microthrix sp.]|uniref:WS/DGAT/MGAT family O-acyltransferase n=1 Tax=Candidatus Neomicrothrix sp. TaxID=2719034 RepID=UPI001B4A90DA|nr:wax ester/triacylglycerol synthase family O-acyltransferase [Candidatus Microthrix sp.]MBP6133864.1 wax ester/triacylglycerol synthase family O-acyltransferase [Candidatus Microthrix sp.]MBP6151136.1 wax ester/triacylglycerol synthase family O-acyltransferase [Candidatus Microthrix sp.]